MKFNWKTLRYDKEPDYRIIRVVNDTGWYRNRYPYKYIAQRRSESNWIDIDWAFGEYGAKQHIKTYLNTLKKPKVVYEQ